MIRNKRQLAIAQRQLRSAIESAEQTAGLDERTYTQFSARLRTEIEEYRAIASGSVATFPVGSVDDLADALVKGRIAAGWTQRDLAERLGVSEQMVQRDEARGYESASLTRLAEIADVLGYELRGDLVPTEARVITAR